MGRSKNSVTEVLFDTTQDLVSYTFDSPPASGCSTHVYCWSKEADTSVGDFSISRRSRCNRQCNWYFWWFLWGFCEWFVVGCSCSVFPGVTDWACSVACNTCMSGVIEFVDEIGLNGTIYYI
jgi:hypothetical protein